MSSEQSTSRWTELDPDFRRDPKTEDFCARCQKDFRPGQKIRWVFLEALGSNAVIHPADVDAAMTASGAGWHRVGLDCAKIIGMDFTLEQSPDAEQPGAKAACCNICKRALDNPLDPLSEDCGGDCLKCMADIGDPDCVAAVAALSNTPSIIDQNKE